MLGLTKHVYRPPPKIGTKVVVNFARANIKRGKFSLTFFCVFLLNFCNFQKRRVLKKKYVFVQKPGQKNRALVPSDEGRVRWSSSVRTMFATGNAFEDRNERTWVTVLTGFVWGIMLWRSRCTVLLHLAFFFVPLKDLLATWSIPVLLALKRSSLHSPHQLL